MNMICRYIGSPPVTETSIQKIIQSRKHSLLNNELTHANNCSWILIVVKNVWREMREAWEDTAFVVLKPGTMGFGRTQVPVEHDWVTKHSTESLPHGFESQS